MVKRAGLIGGAVGGIAAGAAVAIAVGRYAVNRPRNAAAESGKTSGAAATPAGATTRPSELFGQLPADRSYTVTADDGVPLHVEEVGPTDAALTVVFAHGWTLNLGSWHYQRIGLADMTKPRLRMVFYDQRGHGRSGQPSRDSCTVDQLGRDLAAVVDAAVGTRAVALVGHSLGGMGIMALAEQQPKRFERQVVGVALLSTAADALMSTARFGLPRPLRTRGLPAVVRALRATPAATEKARRLGSDLVWLAVRRLAFGSRPVNSELADFVDAMIAATPIEVIADFYPALAGHDKVAALPGLRHTEVLVLCGTADRLTPAQHSRAIAAVLPDATSVLLEGVGHMAMMERSALVNLHLRAFLHRAARRAGGRGRSTPSTRRDANPT